jgi:hypothetical protein
VDQDAADLERDPGADPEPQDDRKLLPGRSAVMLGILRYQGQLLPQSFGVFASELPRHRVEVAETRDRDEEGLVVVEARGPQICDLPSQVVLQLVDIGRCDRLAPQDVAAPPVDVGLELHVLGHQTIPSASPGRWAVCHTWRSASATTVHCS